MDLTTAMKEIESWPIDDQIELVQRIWDRIAESGWEPELTEELKQELDRRMADADAHPENVVTWESILEHIRRKRRAFLCFTARKFKTTSTPAITGTSSDAPVLGKRS